MNSCNKARFWLNCLWLRIYVSKQFKIFHTGHYKNFYGMPSLILLWNISNIQASSVGVTFGLVAITMHVSLVLSQNDPGKFYNLFLRNVFSKMLETGYFLVRLQLSPVCRVHTMHIGFSFLSILSYQNKYPHLYLCPFFIYTTKLCKILFITILY